MSNSLQDAATNLWNVCSKALVADKTIPLEGARMMGEEGREVLVDHLKAPMLLAPAFLFANNNVVPVEVTALTNCAVWHINREAFFEFMQQEPTVLRAFLGILSERGHFLSRKMRTFAVNSLRNRVIE